MNKTNKYSILHSFLCNADEIEFLNFLDNVNPDKLDYQILISFFGGSYDICTRAMQLLNKIPSKKFDYQVLLYLLDSDDRRWNKEIRELIEKIPENNHPKAEASLDMFELK